MQNSDMPVQPQTSYESLDDQSSSVRDFQYSSNNTMETDSMKGDMPASNKIFVGLCAVVVVAGLLTGFGINKLKAKTMGGSNEDTGTSGGIVAKVAQDVNSIQPGQVFGTADEKNFKDKAEGYLEAGGIDGEGSHHLLREGGASQTVYLTSSVTDLSKFEGMRVKVWGETFKGLKAAWLMDVGRVQVVDVKGQKPTE